MKPDQQFAAIIRRAQLFSHCYSFAFWTKIFQHLHRTASSFAASGAGDFRRFAERAARNREMQGEIRSENSASMNEHSVFDLDGTLRRLGGDTGLLTDLIRLYAEDSPDLLRRMATGIESRHGDQVRRAAHSLRGLAANFGAAGLTQLLRRLEDNSAAGQLDDAPRLFKTVQHESARLLAVLAQYSH
jgi:HPt (histidine-containing phosphotransfer) domain-containing protein